MTLIGDFVLRSHTAFDISLTDSAPLELEASDSNTGLEHFHAGVQLQAWCHFKFEVLEQVGLWWS